jgi:hypothetical protein
VTLAELCGALKRVDRRITSGPGLGRTASVMPVRRPQAVAPKALRTMLLASDREAGRARDWAFHRLAKSFIIERVHPVGMSGRDHE